MKNLVLGALLVAAASSAACTSSSGSDVTVTAQWSFKHIADGSPRSCPVGFGMAQITAQPIDPDTVAANGGLITTTLFNCNDMQGVIVVPDGSYLMSVDIADATGTQFYTQKPEEVRIDTATDKAFSVEILDDGGYFFFTWGLIDAASKAPMTCAQAGVTSAGSVEVISTSVANKSFFKDDKFTCEDHYGTTDGLPAGQYTVSVDAEQNNAALGAAVNFTDTITAPNGTTDLGHILVPIN